MKLLLENCIHQEKSIKVKSLQCLIDVGKIHYEQISDYLPFILKVTAQAIISNDKEISIPSIEVWNTIAVEDKERAQNTSEVNIRYKFILKMIFRLVKILYLIRNH